MAEMNRNAVTDQAIRRSNSVIVSEGEPGGPVSGWVTIGRVKLVTSTRIAAPYTAWTTPMATLKSRKRPIRRSTLASVAPANSVLRRDAASTVLRLGRQEHGIDDVHNAVRGFDVGFDHVGLITLAV